MFCFCKSDIRPAQRHETEVAEAFKSRMKQIDLASMNNQNHQEMKLTCQLTCGRSGESAAELTGRSVLNVFK